MHRSDMQIRQFYKKSKEKEQIQKNIAHIFVN